MNGNSNGVSPYQRLLWWSMGSIVAPGVVGMTAFFMHMVVMDNARLTALERDTEHRLHQIETKIDRLLDGARR